MSTPDVPGANPRNSDALHTGCWAESANDDGSYILVEGFENGRVVYELFDTSKTPPVAYRDAMPESRFKRQFSWDGKGVKWTWHDKTEFPWDVIIQKGLQSGQRPAMGSDVLQEAADIEDTLEKMVGDDPDDAGAGSAARRVARDLNLRGRALSGTESNRVRRALTRLRDGIQEAIDELRT